MKSVDIIDVPGRGPYQQVSDIPIRAIRALRLLSELDDRLVDDNTSSKMLNLEGVNRFLDNLYDDDQFRVAVPNTSKNYVKGVVCTSIRRLGGETSLWVEHLATHSDYRGEGVGAELLYDAEERARLAGCGRAVLQATNSALAFYERQGYALSDDRVVSSKLSHRMEKSLFKPSDLTRL